MDPFLQDPVFLGLVASILVVIGLIMGWSLRAAFPERDVRQKLQLAEQNRNTVARLYNHLRHQHDLREADFRRTTLELERMRSIVTAFEQEKAARASADQAAARRLEQAEVRARLLAERVAVLEAQEQKIRARNEAMTHELGRLNEEIHAWKTLHRDFVALQQQLRAFEQSSTELEVERQRLRQQLEAARQHIDALELELLRAAAQYPRRHNGDRRGGPAHRADAPETDDLKIIHGINAVSELQLNRLGIYSLAQISHWDDDAIIATAKQLGISPGKIFKDDWVGQARKIVSGYQQ
jgi:predicted flap endonuclease-1-like 5' DNA nuclease